MAKFLVDWTIEGTKEIEAPNREEAQRQFDRISQRDIAEEGEYHSFRPLTPDEVEREQFDFRSMLNGH